MILNLRFRNSFLLTLILANLLIVSSSCFSRREQPGRPVTVAFVNGMAIREDALRHRLSLERSKYDDETFKESKRFKLLKREILERMVDNRAIIDWGEKQGIVLSQEEKAQGLEELKKGYSEKEFDLMLESKNVPYIQWQSIAEESLTVQKIIQETLAKEITVSPAEMQEFYRKNIDEFQKPEQYRVRHIVTDTEEKAKKIHALILKGENFAKLAIMHSLSPDRAQGGDLGFISPGTHPVEFDQACQKLEPGQVSPVVKSPYGYHIFKMLERRSSGVLSLEEMEPVIRHRLLEKKLDERYPSWLEGIKAQSQIQVLEKELKNMQP